MERFHSIFHKFLIPDPSTGMDLVNKGKLLHLRKSLKLVYFPIVTEDTVY